MNLTSVMLPVIMEISRVKTMHHHSISCTDYMRINDGYGTLRHQSILLSEFLYYTESCLSSCKAQRASSDKGKIRSD